MARLNQFIARLENQQVAASATLRTGDLEKAIKVGDSDLDFAIVDLEHDGFDFPALGNTFQWLQSRRRWAQVGPGAVQPSPLVRLPYDASSPSHWVAAQALDYGAFGFVLPYVESAAQLEAAVDAIRYPGADGSGGRRGVWPRLAVRYWGLDSVDEYIDRADLWPLNPAGELILIAMIATQKAIENIDEILAVPGIGGVLYGPKHAWISMGRRNPVDLDDPDIVAFRDRLVSACAAAGVALGTSATGDAPTGDQTVDPDYLRARISDGFRFFLTPGTSTPPALVAARDGFRG